MIAHLHDIVHAFRGAHLTEQIGLSGNALIYIGKVYCLNRVCGTYSSVRPANVRILFHVRPRPVLYTSFPNHYSLIIVSLDSIQAKLLIASLNDL
jgi:hypothetical protein